MQILAATTPASLVLLDEVGSGTDPVEGAALARAVLDRLASTSRLTAATTHHAELKTASQEDARYVNVSMEFDTATLKPTYRLQWGAAGASNALAIARALGFDSSIVEEAERIAAAAGGSDAGTSAAASGGTASGSEACNGSGSVSASASAQTGPAAAAGGGGERRAAALAESLAGQLEDAKEELEAKIAARKALQDRVRFWADALMQWLKPAV